MTAIRGITCACGSTDLLSVEPGDDGTEIAHGAPWVVRDPVPLRAWCARCAPWLRGLQADLLEEIRT